MFLPPSWAQGVTKYVRPSIFLAQSVLSSSFKLRLRLRITVSSSLSSFLFSSAASWLSSSLSWSRHYFIWQTEPKIFRLDDVCSSPLGWGEPQEEEEADEEDEGHGAADVGHRPHGGDGHGHLLLGVLHGHEGGASHTMPGQERPHISGNSWLILRTNILTTAEKVLRSANLSTSILLRSWLRNMSTRPRKLG